MSHSFWKTATLLFVLVLITSGCTPAGQASLEVGNTGAQSAAGSQIVHAVMYWMEDCGHCNYIIEDVLPPLQHQYQGKFEIKLIELTTREEVDALYHLADQYGISPGSVTVPLLIIGEDVLIGSEEIPKKLSGLIEKYLTAGGANLPDFIKPTGEQRPATILENGACSVEEICDDPAP